MDARKAVKAALATAVNVSGVRTCLNAWERRGAGGRRVVVLGYHRVAKNFETDKARSIETCIISKETFRRHVAYLAEHYELASMTRAVDVLTRRGTAMRDLVVITFDDGYADVLENALPVLKEFGAPATMYVSSGVVANQGHFPHDRLYALLLAYERKEAMRKKVSAFAKETIDRAALDGAGSKAWLHALIRDESPATLERLCEDLAAAQPADPTEAARALDWDGVRALMDGGVEIGAHTVSHCVLTHMPAAEVETELRQSREAIEHAIKRPVRHFAYCNGYWNHDVIRALARTGYASAVTTEDRVNRLGCDPFRIARRVLWEKSAYGADGRTHDGLLACQLDGAWTALGFGSSESGARAEAATEAVPEERRLA